MRSGESVSFSSLESLVGNLERRPQWRSHQTFLQILESWPQVVGDVVAVQTRPLFIQRHVLSVSTSTSVWSQNLAFQRHYILQKLTDHVPNHQLKDIRFSPAKWLDIRKASKTAKAYTFKDGDAMKRSLKRYNFEQSEARSLWSYHPSKLTPSPRPSQGKQTQPQKQKTQAKHPKGQTRSPASEPDLAPSTTPVQTFHDWAAKIQMRSQRLPKCPRCDSPTPIGELQRWSVCSLCVSQDW